MPNPGKAKGYRFERAVVLYLRSRGYKRAVRTQDGSPDDRGDIGGVSWVIQCKDTKKISLAAQYAEAEQQAKNDSNRKFVLINKRQRKPISEAYVTMPMRLWVDYLDLKREVLRLRKELSNRVQ